MKSPNFNEEKKLWKQGYECVVGLDEAGRGPLAGPVVAAAVFLQKNSRVNLKINDSKKLSAKQRDFFYEKITNHKNITWGVGIVSEQVIDKINILQATKLAMKRAIEDLSTNSDGRQNLWKVGFLLIDGNFKIDTSRLRQGSGEPKQKSIIKGDSKVFSIAAASIIAKVTRDRIMEKIHKKYPQYGFNQHKGYPTTLHRAQLASLGACKIHRKTFFPVKGLAKTEVI